MPGKPIFPALQNAELLKPALNWLLQSDRAAQVDAEISYITGGLTWEASYNVIAPEDGDLLDMIGWITLNNRSGHTFDECALAIDGRRGEQDRTRMEAMSQGKSEATISLRYALRGASVTE